MEFTKVAQLMCASSKSRNNDHVRSVGIEDVLHFLNTMVKMTVPGLTNL